MPRVWIGTSGWTYQHWRGRFYPPDLSPRRWLEYYAQRFPTVELNSPFYRVPKRRTFEGWRERTPAGFLFAVKASRLITHVRKLRGAEGELRWFLSEAEGLGEKMGPLLFQLPPSLRADPGLLEAFLTASFLYLRLHGSQRLYASLYSREELSEWASFIHEALESGAKEAFCYFDNDYEAYAVRNALELREILEA